MNCEECGSTNDVQDFDKNGLWSDVGSLCAICRERHAETHEEKEYAFDVKLFATIRVKAASEAEARAMINEHLSCADCNFGAWPNGDPILAEASVDDDEIPLIEIDGEAA